MPFVCPKCGSQFNSPVAGSPANLDCPSCQYTFAAASGIEAETASQVLAPNVVHVGVVGSVGSDRYFASEHVEGDTLAALIHSGNTNPRMVALAGQQIAEALEAAAARGVLHGALSPESVIIDRRGIARLANLGVGASPSIERGRITPYMSPERVTAHWEDFDARSEIYALGAVLYEALTGWPPFVAADDDALTEAIEAGSPTPPRTRNPKVHPDLEKVVMKALSRNRSARQRTFHEFAVDLHRCLSAGGRTMKVEKRPSRLKYLLIFLVLLGLTGGAGYYLWQQHRRHVQEQAREKSAQIEKARQLIAAGKYEAALTQLIYARGIRHGKELDHEILDLSREAKYLGGKLDDALADCTRIVTSGAPEEIRMRAKVTKASVKALKGDIDDAETEFEGLAQGSTGPLSEVVAEGEIALAKLLMEKKRYAQASRVAGHFVELRPDASADQLIETGLLKGRADELRNELAEAWKVYSGLIRKHGNDPKWGGEIAAKLVDLTMRPGSELSLSSEQQELLRGFSAPAIRIGREHLAEGMPKEADSWFDSAAAAAGDDRGSEALAKVLKSRVLLESGRAADAETALSDILRDYPAEELPRAEAKLVLGRARLAGGYAEAARKLFAELDKPGAAAGERRRIAALAAVGLADCHRQRGERDKAAAAYRRALGTYPKVSEAAVEGLVGLGELYQVTKTYADAEKVWKKLLSEFAGAASTRALEIARLMTGKTQIIHVPKRVEGRSAFFTAELYYFGGLKLEQENSIFDAMEYYKRAAEAGGDSYWRTRLAREREKALEG